MGNKFTRRITNGVKTPAKNTKEENQWHQESAEKTLKKKPMASRIRREEYQQEETNGVKNLPR